jgi:hypothetical protein
VKDEEDRISIQAAIFSPNPVFNSEQRGITITAFSVDNDGKIGISKSKIAIISSADSCNNNVNFNGN